MKMAQKTMLRMKNMLKQDKEKISLPLLGLMKSDIYQVTSNYFELNLDDVTISYVVGEDNKYHFNITFLSKRIKKMNFLN